MKRMLDFILAIILSILLFPFMLIISLLIVIDTPGKPIFSQIRVGQNSKAFTIYKFRTMRTDTPDVPTNEMDNRDKYITSMGKFLRKTSLDELPQLYNILKGDMSFVGPRPPLFSQEMLVENRKESGVDQLKPGVTGWAQINGRDDMDDSEKFEYDFWYFKNRSLWLDIKIIFLTVLQVFKGEGVKENIEDSNE
ncbi:sugar transferase [Halarsenatibacter silvermanii]|uniref:O-antigen biosynthesis protein WbqP n=1 Tax=Halarsenatibacter silvermanii TaxID=321763 RepID=A0A1G9S9G5_9FIRM|nr:sugar transferase [Halarsenatibacter silvermanii]SDM32153.1 O-antigen biosynthesis protein WbqP [Halarsenatibacter silvermanii]